MGAASGPCEDRRSDRRSRSDARAIAIVTHVSFSSSAASTFKTSGPPSCGRLKDSKTLLQKFTVSDGRASAKLSSSSWLQRSSLRLPSLLRLEFRMLPCHLSLVVRSERSFLTSPSSEVNAARIWTWVASSASSDGPPPPHIGLLHTRQKSLFSCRPSSLTPIHDTFVSRCNILYQERRTDIVYLRRRHVLFPATRSLGWRCACLHHHVGVPGMYDLSNPKKVYETLAHRRNLKPHAVAGRGCGFRRG